MRFPPRLGALIAVVLWGISFVATKAALQEVSPVTLIFTRFFIGTAFLLLAARALPPRDAWRELLVMGLVGVFIHQMLQAFALTMTTAVHTGWLIGVIPIWSAILSALILEERFGWRKVLGIIGGFAGALLVISRGELSSAVLQLPSTKGDLLILLSTVNWAVYSIIGHRTIRRIGPTRATTGAFLAGVALLAPFFIAKAGWRELPRVTPAGWGAILFLGIGCSGLGYLFWYGALERIEVSRVAVLLYLEPLVTFATAVALLHEPVSAIAVIGGLLVMLSVILTSGIRTETKPVAAGNVVRSASE
ncbi:MAG TPA: EamA family transporter [Thermoanaerobaculia bacterium]|nr:EamA family transporter [Thermoanaerobaculia bacterium]